MRSEIPEVSIRPVQGMPTCARDGAVLTVRDKEFKSESGDSRVFSHDHTTCHRITQMTPQPAEQVRRPQARAGCNRPDQPQATGPTS